MGVEKAMEASDCHGGARGRKARVLGCAWPDLGVPAALQRRRMMAGEVQGGVQGWVTVERWGC